MSGLSPAEENDFRRVFVEMGRHFTQRELRAELIRRGWSENRIEAAVLGIRPDLSLYVTKN